jgi:predicted phage gp36 major capsid-like protein
LTPWESFREFFILQDRVNRMNRLFRESYSPEGQKGALTTTTFRATGGHLRRRAHHCSEA